MVPQWIIEKKRDGKQLLPKEIHDFINGFTDGAIPEYQMSALAMAIFFKGMSTEEISALTEVMMKSGEVLELPSISRPKADKHSTGGIGDKVSLILAPLAASCGLAVPMISGRGLGITGGTLDKLESISGYRTDLTPAEFENVIRKCGCSIIGQTADLAPADKKLYALRDVTGTVPSIPLISASIMSKKMAEGADSLVLDVKWGSGAFMKTQDKAKELAQTMIGIGASMQRNVSALITNMNQPLGATAGNALEVAESIDTLNAKGPDDLTLLTLELCAEMLVLAGLSDDLPAALDLAKANLESGAALDVFAQMIELQGGDTAILSDQSLLPASDRTLDITCPTPGYVETMDAELIGRAALLLGAGRQAVTDTIDPAAGISQIAKIGTKVAAGDILMRLHTDNDDLIAPAQELAAAAFAISATPPPDFMLITERVSGALSS